MDRIFLLAAVVALLAISKGVDVGNRKDPSADVMIGFDCSTEIPNDTYNAMLKKHIPKLVEKLIESDISVRVALFAICDTACDNRHTLPGSSGIILNLTTGTSYTAVRGAINDFNRPTPTRSRKPWPLVFSMATHKVFTEYNAAREDARKVLVVAGDFKYLTSAGGDQCQKLGKLDLKASRTEFLKYHPEAVIVSLGAGDYNDLNARSWATVGLHGRRMYYAIDEVSTYASEIMLAIKGHDEATTV